MLKDTNRKIGTIFSIVHCGKTLVTNLDGGAHSSAFVAPLETPRLCLCCWNRVWDQ